MPVAGAPASARVLECAREGRRGGTRLSPSAPSWRMSQDSSSEAQQEQRAMIHLQFRCLPPTTTSSSSSSSSSSSIKRSSSYSSGNHKPAHLSFSESCLEGLASPDSCDSINSQGSSTAFARLGGSGGDASSPGSCDSGDPSARAAGGRESGEERADRLFLWGAVRVIFPISAPNAQEATVSESVFILCVAFFECQYSFIIVQALVWKGCSAFRCSSCRISHFVGLTGEPELLATV